MRMHTIAANDMRALETEANRRGISKDQIVQVFQTVEGIFTMVYYEED